MNAKEAKHHYQLKAWAPIVRDCKNSGMTVKAWCKENDINEKQFYYWQRRVREELLQSVSSAQQETTFVQLPDVSQNGNAFKADMVLKLGNLQMELSNSVSEQLLNKVMKVIHHV